MNSAPPTHPDSRSQAPGLIVGSQRSGAGKTTLVAGLLRALGRRGLVVRPAKSGPDYIDPLYHASAAGRPGPNLDSWAMPPSVLDDLVARARHDVDLLLVESAMGLFDGVAGGAEHLGSGAHLAARYGLPVVLLLDVTGQFQTAVAVVRGLATHHPGVRIAGVVLNRVASPRHSTSIVEGIGGLGIPVLGSLPRATSLELPSRHLGLIQAMEHAEHARWLDGVADVVEQAVDLDALLRLATPPGLDPIVASKDAPLSPPGRQIALASDAAFSFVYPHVLEGWERAGSRISRFSPLADEAPPEGCDACWLPGGYPELHAARLASAARFHAGLRAFAERYPVHGECGGFMVLGASLEDGEGRQHRMTSLLGHSTSFARRRLHLGYREAAWRATPAFGSTSRRIRGHEFHYTTVVDPGPDAGCVDLFDGSGRPLGVSGGRRGRVSGTFFHAIAEV